MLTLIKKVESRNGKQYGLYRCVCGVEKIIRIAVVNSGSTKSCGCYRRKNAYEMGKGAITHGQTGTYLHTLWLQKISKNCVWNTFEEFYEWANKKWSKGLTLYSENGYYDEKSTFIPSIKSKEKNRKKTCLKKYGCSSALQSTKVKQKIRETNIKKYGVPNPSKTKQVKQNTIKNNREKYGVDYPQQLEENKKRQKQYAIKKIGYDSEEWAKKIGMSRSGFNALVRKYGFDKAIIIGKYNSHIEGIVANILDKYNIKYNQNQKIDKYFSDFILPDYNLIIETDGLYWHSDAVNTNYKYHREKLDCYNSSGYRSLFFRENEVENKQKIITSIILNSIDKSNKIYARKCKIIKLNRDLRRDFFNTNHLMGRGYGECFGLEYEDRIVCALQYTNRNGLVDISRFCNILNITVVGGYSKLINCIIENEDINKIQTFVDKRYGTGNYLYKLGFQLITDRLSFVWVKNDKVFHRLRYKGNSGYDYGMHKLWDCGQAKFERIIK